MHRNALEHLVGSENKLITDLREFVRIPSQSGTPALKGEVRRAAEWLAGKLTEVGMEQVELLETGGHPVVYGDWLHAGEAPIVLIYGHYDVQPPEPLDLWESPPFEPEIRDNRLYGRGAADDKAGLMATVTALRALFQSGETPSVNIKLCFEGEEETGSPNLGALIEKEKTRFAADLVLSVDGAQWNENQPQVMLGLRGTIATELTVKGPDHDLHSGLLGGAVLNPIEALARILASMRAPDGRITIEGFYDDVVEYSEEARAAINAIPNTSEQLLEASGAPCLHGEAGYTPIEQTWIRPTLEINGIYGGHSGPGPKTIIPAEAGAKITCRLAADQDPDKIIRLLDQHIAAHTPKGVTSTFRTEPVRAFPYDIRRDHPANRLLAEVLEEVYGVAPYETRVGGSVPVFEVFSRVLKTDTITLGCGTANCNLHAPNEFIHLPTLHRGVRALVLLLQRLGTLPELKLQ